MKKSVKLTALHQQALEERQLNGVKGSGEGGYCVCGCAYEDRGGSNTLDNGAANARSGRKSPGGGRVFIEEVVISPE
ncbi:MAG: rSAM-modified peptide [Bacteroidales bacterium]|nr:rSAM-modified peptide [Bacteroidales bacterium]